MSVRTTWDSCCAKPRITEEKAEKERKQENTAGVGAHGISSSGSTACRTSASCIHYAGVTKRVRFAAVVCAVLGQELVVTRMTSTYIVASASMRIEPFARAPMGIANHDGDWDWWKWTRDTGEGIGRSGDGANPISNCWPRPNEQTITTMTVSVIDYKLRGPMVTVHYLRLFSLHIDEMIVSSYHGARVCQVSQLCWV